MSQVYLIILGSLLALITSLVVEIYRDWGDRKNKSRNLKIMLELEIGNSIALINKLVEGYGSKHYYEFRILNQIKACVDRLDKLREQVVFIKEDIKKSEILEFINLLSVFHSDLSSLENWAFSVAPPASTEQGEKMPWNNEYFKGERQTLSIRCLDMKRTAQDLLKNLK